MVKIRLLQVLVCALGVLSGCSKPVDKLEAPRPVRAVTLVAAQQQVLAEYSGNVQARIESRLGFRVPGKLLTRKVDVGTLVRPGQLLMQLDPQDLHLAQERAQANLKAAESQYQLAEFELKRYQELFKANALSKSALDSKDTAFEAAKASLDQARAGFQEQSNQTAYASLVADVEGVVTAINAEVGQVVAAGSPVIHLAKAGELEVVVGIPENGVDLVSRADHISVHLWANSQTLIEGKIREMSPVADPATRTFTAKIALLDPAALAAAKIKLGMTASVRFALTTAREFVKKVWRQI